jgi:hypothetical protein
MTPEESQTMLVELSRVLNEYIKCSSESRHDLRDQLNALAISQENNAAAIAAIIEETKDVTQLYADLQGAARVGLSVQRVLATTAKLTFIGAALSAMGHWVINYFTPGG